MKSVTLPLEHEYFGMRLSKKLRDFNFQGIAQVHIA